MEYYVMKPRRTLLTFIFLVSMNTVAAQQKLTQVPVNVTFYMNSPALDNNDTVYITGSIPQLGSWDPSRIRMNHTGDHQWGKTISVIRPMYLEYKFTRGSWEREAADANGQPLQNFYMNVLCDTVMRNNILFWKNGPADKKVHGQITGTVEYLRNVEGEGLLPRDVIIWLPPGYKENRKERYPVLYMQDGQNIIDPATSAFGTDWGVDEACDSMIMNRSLEPLIIVGIYNTADRSLEYTPGDTGDQYMKFIVMRLKPIIDSSYRTLPDREHTYVAGSSAGALISFMLAWQYPDVFSAAICFSPAFKIFHIDYVKYVEQSRHAPIQDFFYFYNGGIGLDAQLQPGVDDMIAALRLQGYREGWDYMFISDENGRHSEIYWAKQFPRAIRMVVERR